MGAESRLLAYLTTSPPNPACLRDFTKACPSCPLLSKMTTAFLVAKSTCTFFTPGVDFSAASTRGLQPIGQVMPETASVRLGRPAIADAWVPVAEDSGVAPCCPHPRMIAPAANKNTISLRAESKRFIRAFLKMVGQQFFTGCYIPAHLFCATGDGIFL